MTEMKVVVTSEEVAYMYTLGLGLDSPTLGECICLRAHEDYNFYFSN